MNEQLFKKEKRGQATHELKCWLASYEAVVNGSKTHEVRINDRDYRLHDFLYLHEWNEWSGSYTGKSVKALVTHITEGGKFGLAENVCVMSISLIPGTRHQ